MRATLKLQDTLAGLWTVQDLRRMFRVTPMTIHNWRKRRALPTIYIPGTVRPALRFIPGDVMPWAKRNNVPIKRVLRATAQVSQESHQAV